jgi:hypothetical protein
MDILRIMHMYFCSYGPIACVPDNSKTDTPQKRNMVVLNGNNHLVESLSNKAGFNSIFDYQPGMCCAPPELFVLLVT